MLRVSFANSCFFTGYVKSGWAWPIRPEDKDGVRMRRKFSEISGTEPVTVGLMATDEASRGLMEEFLPHILAELKTHFPEFTWKVEMAPDTALVAGSLSPVKMIDLAYLELLERRWDFCVVMTGGRLDSRESPSAWLMASVSHSSAVISLHGLQSLPGGREATKTLFLNLFLEALARLNGVRRAEVPALLREEKVLPYDTRAMEKISMHLRELVEAVPREELREMSRLAWYLRIVFRHPVWVARSVTSLRPWAMVYRSTRLLFASLATTILSLMTIEFWDLGMGQNIWRTALLAVGLILLATLFVIWKHRLLLRREGEMLSVHAAVFDVATLISVFLGFALLFALLFALNVFLSMALFPRALVSRWLALDTEKVPLSAYFRVSLFVSCLALIVGALGAGLEDSEYFRFMLYGSRKG